MSRNKKTNPIKSKLSTILILSTLVAFGGIGVLFGIYLSKGSSPGDGEVSIEYELMRGVGAQRVSKDLSAEGIIKDPEFFKLMLRFTGNSGALKTGVYELNDGMSAWQVMNVLTEGKVRMLSVTIPEGYTNRQIGDVFKQKGLVASREEFLELASDHRLLAKYNIPAQSSEGYLFPDTYMVPLGYTGDKLIEIMVRQFFAVLKEASDDTKLSPTELHKEVILASIIEREAAHSSELPMMAQVFKNRLQKRMRLESCATVQYIFDKPKKRLFDKDINTQHPYNTYLHRGLPPGPVSNPGKKALHATFHPTPTENLFFVLKEDGSHHFSPTFKEHLAAKKEFLDPIQRTNPN